MHQSRFNWLGFNRLLDVPIGAAVLVVVALIGNLVLSRTAFGRCLYASGGNERAAAASRCTRQGAATRF